MNPLSKARHLFFHIELLQQATKLLPLRSCIFNFSGDGETKSKHNACLSGMDFSLTQEQKELIRLAERFTSEEIIPNAPHYDRTGEYPWPIVKKAHKTGLMNWYIPQEYGGMGLGTLDGCLLLEKMAYGCNGIMSAISANHLGATPIMISGNHEQKKKYLSWLLEEPIVCAYGVTEPGAGSDVAGIKTKAVKKGKAVSLNI